eukprot:5645847-Pyramimonas_sp.AAC.1
MAANSSSRGVGAGALEEGYPGAASSAGAGLKEGYPASCAAASACDQSERPIGNIPQRATNRAPGNRQGNCTRPPQTHSSRAGSPSGCWET